MPEQMRQASALLKVGNGGAADAIVRQAARAGKPFLAASLKVRDQQGLEVDFLLPRPDRKLWLIECKASRTVQPQAAGPLRSLGQAIRGHASRLLVINRGSPSSPPTRALTPGALQRRLTRPRLTPMAPEPRSTTPWTSHMMLVRTAAGRLRARSR